MPVVAVDLGQRTPGGQIDQTGAAQPAEGLVGQLSRPFQTEGVDGFEDRQLGVPGTVTVDRLSGRGRMSLGGAGLGTLVGVEVCELRNDLRAHVQRVKEETAAGQIR